jgi:hypothetical protein
LELRKYYPSETGAAIIFLARKQTGVIPTWSKELEELTRQSESQVKRMSKLLEETLKPEQASDSFRTADTEKAPMTCVKQQLKPKVYSYKEEEKLSQCASAGQQVMEKPPLRSEIASQSKLSIPNIQRNNTHYDKPTFQSHKSSFSNLQTQNTQGSSFLFDHSKAEPSLNDNQRKSAAAENWLIPLRSKIASDKQENSVNKLAP